MKKRLEIVLKLATKGQSDNSATKGLSLTSTFVPKGLSAPALGLYTCIKAGKYIYKDQASGERLQNNLSSGFK